MFLDWIRANYDWQAALAFVGLLALTSIVGNYLTFKIPVLAEMRETNRAVDKTKLARETFRNAVKINNKSGLYTNLAFYVTILPFCVGFDSRPIWRHVVDVFAVLLVFDFMYYLTHRFLFHGNLLRKVHALHHQARKPTYVDALYVHPLETFIGLSLFLGTIPLVAAVAGGPLHVGSMVVATLLFTHLNSLNHVYTNLPAPFGWVNTITGVHAAHHVDMSHGNYATLTMIYDKMFGTYEAPIIRETA
jgi:sterol desaturase/sphingolipid hydroxylase (fatty acid hydroxylase superfamily)